MISIKVIILAIASFLLSFILTPITIPLCHTVGALDKPDGKRKINTLPTPRLGGIAFFTSFFILSSLFAKNDSFIAAILAGGSVLVAGGFADDVFDLPPRMKLLIQISASAVAIGIAGAPSDISFFGIFSLSLPFAIGTLFAIFKTVFAINAVNFSDGLDGLAAGLSSVAFLSLFVYGVRNGNFYPALASLLLAAAVIGFLPYNKYRAKTFMGDSGSQFLGFAFSVLSLGCAKNHAYTVETTLFLIIPAVDTVVSVLRRIAKRKSPFSADKGHLHHILLRGGLSHPDSVKLLVLLNSLIALVTLIILSS